ncbi:MAG: hypothetical protein M1833_000601 [Piccolia ochrophora]|nr:MAG: hypothetical protein M1833_000601 [Piccolia ochrophora]
MGKLTPAEIAWAEAHPDEYSCQGLGAFLIVGITLSTLAVVLRLWSRRVRKLQFASDDYTIVAALVLFFGGVFSYLLMYYHYGYGRHLTTLTKSQQVNFYKCNFAFNILYTAGYPLSKISLTLFYRRLFVQRWFRVLCWILVGIFICYSVSVNIANICSVIPTNAYWDHDVTPTKAIDGNALFQANAAFNIATDFLLLIMPMTVLWKLKISNTQKLGVSLIFVLGVFTCVASIMRVVLYRDSKGKNDDPFVWGTSVWWTAGEVFLAIICACLPTFRPLILMGYKNATSYISSGHGSKGTESFTSKEANAPFHTEDYRETGGVHGLSGADVGTRANAYHEKSNSTSESDLERGVPQDSIGVRTELDQRYATAKDEFEIAVEETEKKSVYARDDRAAAREELEKLKEAYSDAVKAESGVSAEIKSRVGQRVRELENAVEELNKADFED